jgi:Site-specific recombinase XerD
MFVLSGALESEYLAVAAYPLRQVAVLMLDLGLRPEECVRLRKDDVCGATVSVGQGKTANARRVLPQTERSIAVFRLSHELFPDSEWVFPGRKKGTHLTRSRVTACHVQLRRRWNEAEIVVTLGKATDRAHWPDSFVLYSLRHTFGTRLAECGRSVFEICALMGHSSVKISEKYVHLGSDHLTVAMRQLELYGKGLRGESEVHSPPPFQPFTKS